MPIYEYECEDCRHCFEHLTLSAGEKAPHCPECQSEKTRRLMSASCVLGTSGKSGCAPSPSAKFG